MASERFRLALLLALTFVFVNCQSDPSTDKGPIKKIWDFFTGVNESGEVTSDSRILDEDDVFKDDFDVATESGGKEVGTSTKETDESGFPTLVPASLDTEKLDLESSSLPTSTGESAFSTPVPASMDTNKLDQVTSLPISNETEKPDASVVQDDDLVEFNATNRAPRRFEFATSTNTPVNDTVFEINKPTVKPPGGGASNLEGMKQLAAIVAMYFMINYLIC